jgi:hypothetical protein
MDLQKTIGLLLGIALATTLILPGRQTVPVINAGSNLAQGVLGTAMGTKK